MKTVTRTFAAAAALAALGLAPVPAVAASTNGSTAEPTYDLCLNQPAEIVGTKGTVRGTSDADVIVAGPGTTVLSGGGDDLVCTYGGNVKAGSGDDSVVVLPSGTARTGDLELGQGEDSVQTSDSAQVFLDTGNRLLRSDAGRFTLENVETYFALSDNRVRVRGSAGPDVIQAEGCHVLVHGADDLCRAEVMRHCDH